MCTVLSSELCYEPFNLKLHTVTVSSYYRVRLKFFKEYKFFISSYINILTMLLLYTYIILHGVESNARWAFASLAYFLYTLKGIRFLLMIR